MLYLDGRSPPEFRVEPFFFVTGLSYLFLRFVILAVEMRPTRAAQAQPVRCPECGQWIDGATSEALEAHRRAESPPKPSRKGVVATVALRRAIDAVRFSAQARHPEHVAGDPSVGPLAENPTGQELVAALNDPDFLERARHGPSPPDRRIRR